MEDPKNYVESNAYNNYYGQTDSNFDLNQEKNITNKAKEMIKTFKNQYLVSNDNNQRITTTEINQINQNYQPYQVLEVKNKAREDLNSYDYYFGSSRGGNRENTPTRNKYIDEKVEHNIDFIGQENAKLKKQVMDLMLENKNLQNKINNNYPSPILNKDNFSNINSINRQEQMYKPESENINMNNINMNLNNNMMNIPLNDKKFLEESIESIIKTNMKLGQNIQNNNDMKKNLFELKKYDNYKMGYLKKNKNYNQDNYSQNNYNTNNYNLNNDNNYQYSAMNNNYNNNDKYLTIMNEYNQLLEDYKSNKLKLEKLQQDLESRKNINSKYKALNNNYIELQNRNKELVITIQKMKNDNTVLTHHIEELNKQKKLLKIIYIN